ncbi:MAG TPA: hypothetical protein VMY37_10020 [Thermoguttaceae bacterium]|nr:hypothetical protein [Thermoguttaceae bacterium]
MSDKRSAGVEWLCPLDKIVSSTSEGQTLPAGDPLANIGKGTRVALNEADLLDAALLVAKIKELGQMPEVAGVGPTRQHEILLALAAAGGDPCPTGGSVKVIQPNPLVRVIQDFNHVTKDSKFGEGTHIAIGFPSFGGKTFVALRLGVHNEHLRRTLAQKLNSLLPEGEPRWHAYRGGVDDQGIGMAWEAEDKAAWVKSVK